MAGACKESPFFFFFFFIFASCEQLTHKSSVLTQLAYKRKIVRYQVRIDKLKKKTHASNYNFYSIAVKVDFNQKSNTKQTNKQKTKQTKTKNKKQNKTKQKQKQKRSDEILFVSYFWSNKI